MLRATSRDTLSSRHGTGVEGAYVASASRTAARLDVTEGESAKGRRPGSPFSVVRFVSLGCRFVGWVMSLFCFGKGVFFYSEGKFFLGFVWLWMHLGKGGDYILYSLIDSKTVWKYKSNRYISVDNGVSKRRIKSHRESHTHKSNEQPNSFGNRGLETRILTEETISLKEKKATWQLQ